MCQHLSIIAEDDQVVEVYDQFDTQESHHRLHQFGEYSKGTRETERQAIELVGDPHPLKLIW